MKKLRATRRAIKPWHIYASLAVVIITLAVVLPTVLVTKRNRERAIEEDKRTPSSPADARVNLGYAQYQGSLVGTDAGVAQYLGMRYAAPPTGERRWRAPVEPEVDNSGDQAADSFKPICLGISEPYPNTDSQDEDCLYVNVWAPANATLESKLPVWLFIQGGGYTVNSNANYNGTAVVERSGRNIVFVNFNYRVGLWGFLGSERVRAGGAGDLNAGLLDQREVMRWVRRHVAQFGGDPGHVVIHGASAGAGSVAMHLLMSYAESRGRARDQQGNSSDTDSSRSSSSSENLFIGAIGESPFFPAQPAVADLEWQFDLVLAQTGCANNNNNNDDDGSQDAMSCLRSKDTSALQLANVPSSFPGAPGAPAPLPLFYWTPCVDGALLRSAPSALLARGEFAKVPLMAGTTTDEGTVFTPPGLATSGDMAAFLRANYPDLNSSQADAASALYPQKQQQQKQPRAALQGPWFPPAAAAYGEATFICPTEHLLASCAQYEPRPGNATNATGTSAPVWSYRYDVLDPVNVAQGLGVPHIWESWAVFGPDSIDGVGRGPASYYGEAAGVVGWVMDYWISFVRTLDPSTLRTPGAPVWEAWSNGTDGAGRRLLMQVGNFTMETVPEEQRERCEFWEGVASEMQQ